MSQKVFITGGSSGIGLAAAYIYAKKGYHVTIAGRNKERLVFACEGCEQGELFSVELDVSDAEQVASVCSAYLSEHGAPDILINSAGIMIPGEFLEMSKEDFNANVDIDFYGTVEMCRAFGSAMAARGSGTIVNVASVAGFLGIYGYTSYSAAKFAVMGFSEALRFEMEPFGVKVCVVCPPDTSTPGLEAEKLARPYETEVVAGSIKPVDPKVVACAMVRGIEKSKREIIIGALSKFYYRLKGLLPEVFYYAVTSDVKKARRTKQR